MKTAILYFRGSKIYIQPYSQTTDGAWIASTPVTFCDPQHSSLLGSLVNEALAISVTGVPHPTEFNHLIKPLLVVTGVRTWAQFVKGARSLMVEQTEAEFVVTPYTNNGATDGFDSIRSSARKFPIGKSQAELGEMILHVFEECK